MAISFKFDGYCEPANKVRAEPFDEANAERDKQVRDYLQTEERRIRSAWIRSDTRPPYSSLDFLTFPLDPDVMPDKRRLTEGGTDWDISGFVGFRMAPAVSEAFRDVIEALEPGVHQFIPFDLIRADGSKTEKQFFVWRIRTTLEAINPETGGVKKSIDVEFYDFVKIPERGQSENFSVHKDLVAGHAAWRDIRYPSYAFLSDAAAQALRDAGIVGWTEEAVWKEV